MSLGKNARVPESQEVVFAKLCVQFAHQAPEFLRAVRMHIDGLPLGFEGTTARSLFEASAFFNDKEKMLAPEATVFIQKAVRVANNTIRLHCPLKSGDPSYGRVIECLRKSPLFVEPARSKELA